MCSGHNVENESSAVLVGGSKSRAGEVKVSKMPGSKLWNTLNQEQMFEFGFHCQDRKQRLGRTKHKDSDEYQ